MKGLPVKAHRDSGTYRVRKFVNRHRVETVAACLIFLALVVGLAVALLQTQKAQIERDRAEIALDESREVSAFLIDLFEASDPYESMGRDISARELLARGMSRIDELDTHPVVQAQLLGVIGRVHQNLGDYREAEDLLNRSLSMRRDLLGPDDATVSESLRDLADLHRVEGRYAISERLFEEALDLQQQAQGVDPLERAETMEKFAILLDQKGNYKKAEPLLREAIAIKVEQHGAGNSDVLESQERKVFGVEHPVIATTIFQKGIIQMIRNDYVEAYKYYNEALTMRRRLLSEGHPDMVLNLRYLGLLAMGDRDFVTARKYFVEALKMGREKMGDDHPETQLLEALDILEHHPEKNEKTRRWQYARARVARELALLYEAWNRPEDADRYRSEATDYWPDEVISGR